MPLDLDLARDADGAQALGLADRETASPAELGAVEPALGLEARKPGLPLALLRRKNALKALSSRLSTCCSAE
jgi:hypothetical protein